MCKQNFSKYTCKHQKTLRIANMIQMQDSYVWILDAILKHSIDH